MKLFQDYLKKIKNALGKSEELSTPENDEKNELSEINFFLDHFKQEAAPKMPHYFGLKVQSLPHFEAFQQKDNAFKKAFLFHCIRLRAARKGQLTSLDMGYNLLTSWLIPQLMRFNWDYTFDEMAAFFDEARKSEQGYTFFFPVEIAVNHLEKIVARESPTPEQVEWLRGLVTDKGEAHHFRKSGQKYELKLLEILAKIDSKNTGKIPPVLLDEEDAFGQFINQQSAQFSPEKQQLVYPIIAHLKKASTPKPAKKFLQDLGKLTKALGEDVWRETRLQWLVFLKEINPEVIERTHDYHYPNGTPYTYTYTDVIYLRESTIQFAKGLVWAFEGDLTRESMSLLTALAEKCYRKIPTKGPLTAALGNACLYVLAQGGLEGVGYLSRLKLRVRQSSTQAMIEGYIRTGAEALGVTPAEIEDMATPSFGLVNGRLEETWEGYKAEVEVEPTGKVAFNWYKPDGSPMKSVPAVVKEKFADELKELKSDYAEIQKTLSAQRDRLDRSFVLDREWTWEAFDQYYFSHGLMACLAHRLIWELTTDEGVFSAFFLEGKWVDFTGKLLVFSQVNKVKLWHPVGRPMEEIMAWREWLAQREIQQPIKQAYREIYLLTDAEIRTRTYSNRMAAHVLKQHQFNSLAKARGWKYSLLGAYDKGYETEKASLALPNSCHAEFWVQEIYVDGEWNDTGIYNYVSTDQVRFYQNGQQLELVQVPKLMFSEVMCDVDLFVGVASVGNDPNWQDNGLAQYRDYWAMYSFGELGELSKTRKQTLEKLVPKLKIASKCRFTDRFLVVQGQLRTYKIHYGSSNILMEPNDQYLCIVPGAKVEGQQSIMLPFEGDKVLSIILSKAFLLAEDQKITDRSILSQIMLGR